MAVYCLFRSKAFEPEAISALSGAYADICRTLGVSAHDEPEANAVARKVIEFAQRGVSDRIHLRERVLQELRV